MGTRKLALFPLLLVFLLHPGCATTTNLSDKQAINMNKSTTQEQSRQKTEDTAANAETEQTDSEIAAGIITDFIHNMSDDELIGQILMPALIDEQGKWITHLSNQTAEWLHSMHIGNVIFFEPNIQNEKQTLTLINKLQQTSPIPLIIAIDHEGGPVNRFSNLPDSVITKLPSQQSIGKRKSGTYIYNLARSVARELLAIGFTMNLAPVADIVQNNTSPVIASRAFGSSPQLVANMVYHYTRGLQSENVSAVLKHFPGHGATSVDSHDVLPIINATYEKLNTTDLIPFRRGIAAGVDAIMIAHINYPNIGSENTPATTDSKIITDLLRTELQFSGVVMTDSLVMRSVLQGVPYKKVVIQTILAGTDILLRPPNIQITINIIKQALKDKTITRKHLAASVHRILTLKVKRKLLAAHNNMLQSIWTPAKLNYNAVLTTRELIRK